jgi:hypothetical protein
VAPVRQIGLVSATNCEGSFPVDPDKT